MPVHKNLASLLEDHAAASPERVLFIYNDKEIRGAEIREDVCRLTAALRSLRIERGSRVLLMLPNIPEYFIAYHAILRLGGIVVPVNVMLKERELHYLMDNCEAHAIVAPADCARDVLAAAESLDTMRQIILLGDNLPKGTEALEKLIENHESDETIADVYPDDTAVIMYTAGTTGRPKGAELSHYNLMSNARAGVNLLKIKSRDRFIGVIPFFHAFGQTAVMNTALAAGSSVVLLPRFEPEETMNAVQKHGVSIFVAVPAMYSLILSHPGVNSFNFKSVKYCVSGGSALKTELLKAFEERFSSTILEGYGLSETTSVTTFNHIHRERRPGSIGTPIEGVEVKVVKDDESEVLIGEVGEITIRSEYLMKGYLNRPEATRQVMKGGWFHTGDLARVDEDGFLYIVDRKTDMIVKSGFNVYPREIEELLLDYPGIAEVAVIGVPDPVRGEAIKACIILRPGAQVTAADLAAYCRERLARYKCPRYVQFYQQLPKSPAGRILKMKLRP